MYVYAEEMAKKVSNFSAWRASEWVSGEKWTANKRVKHPFWKLKKKNLPNIVIDGFGWEYDEKW